MITRSIARLAGAGAAAGVLVAAIALPAVGGAGALFKTASAELNLKPRTSPSSRRPR